MLNRASFSLAAFPILIFLLLRFGMKSEAPSRLVWLDSCALVLSFDYFVHQRKYSGANTKVFLSRGVEKLAEFVLLCKTAKELFFLKGVEISLVLD